MIRPFDKCSWCAVVAIAVSTAGCAAPTSATSGEAMESVGTTSQALSTANELLENGLTTNALWENGSWTNGSWTNGSWTNGSWTNGSWTNGSWTNGSLVINGVQTNGSWTNGSWTNGSWTNGSWTNGSWTNGSWTNGSSTNGSWTNGSWTNGLWSNGSWTNGAGGEALRSDRYARQFLQYVYECAMPGDDPVTGEPTYRTTLDPNNGELACGVGGTCDKYYTCQNDKCVIELKGAIGLGINGDVDESTWWETGTCDETCQRWVSACVLARTNAYGVRVEISMRAPANAPQKIKDALKLSFGDPSTTADDESTLYPIREGGFYGNIFATTPVNPGVDGPADGPILTTPNLHACAGPGSNIPHLTKRFCSSQGAGGVIDVTGVCLPTPLQPQGACESIDQPDVGDTQIGALQNCSAGSTEFSQVITVYIHDLIEVCGNAVCETNEENDASCSSDCHPGTWSKSWNAKLGASAVDHQDGSVVIAGTTSDNIDFGGGVLLPIAGQTNDLVLAKFTADGAHLWSRRLQNDFGTVTSSAVTDDGTIVLAGTNSVTKGGWVAKFDGGTDTVGAPTGTDGDLLPGWPVTFGPATPTSGRVSVFDRIAVDHAGNVIGAGSFAKKIQIGSSPELDRPIGAFLFRIPSAGAPAMASAWSRDFADDSSNVSGLSVDPFNDLLVTLISGSDSFVYKLAGASGAEIWHKQFDSLQISSGGVAADSSGAVYVTGSAHPFDFGGGISHADPIGQFFLVKYGSDGTYRWNVGEAVNPEATRLYSSGLQLMFDASGNVVVGGQFGTGTVDLGVGLFNAYASDDLFIASYATSDVLAPNERRLRWAKHVPMVLAGFFFGADVGGGSRIFAAGQFSGSMLVDDVLMVSEIPEEPDYYHTFLSSFVLPGSSSPSGTDSTAPAIEHLPEPMVVQAQSLAGAVVWFMPPTAIDEGNAGTSVSCLPEPNSLFPMGETTVTCRASDPFGNFSEAEFTVTVRDSLAPFWSDVPADIGPLEATSCVGAIATFPTPTATDQVYGATAVTCDPASGAVYGLGTTPVVCSSSDGYDPPNSSAVTFNVSVVDTTPPVLTLPGNVTMGAVGPGGATVSYEASASDIADCSVIAECSPASGSQFGLGTTPVTCTATDEAGLTTTGTFQVTVFDMTAPVLTVPADITVEATDASGAVVNYVASAVDDVDGVITPQCTWQSPSTFPIATTLVSCTATDAANNFTTKTFNVTVFQADPPPPLQYSWSGFLQPINVDGSSIFKLGKIVPVKFKLTGDSAGITDAVATLLIAKVSSNVSGSYLEATSISVADSGNLFRYDASSDQYVFNLATTTLSTGTWLLSVDLGDGVPRTVEISLR